MASQQQAYESFPQPSGMGVERRRVSLRASSGPGTARGTILIVDDDPDALTLLRALLRSEGFEVQTALSGLAALECVRQHRPDLIITDVRMPGMNGYELCQTLRDSSETRHIPIIVHSGEGVPAAPHPLYEQVFLKPVELVALLNAVHRLVAAARSERRAGPFEGLIDSR